MQYFGGGGVVIPLRCFGRNVLVEMLWCSLARSGLVRSGFGSLCGVCAADRRCDNGRQC